MRRALDERFVDSLWVAAGEGATVEGASCPVCIDPMTTVRTAAAPIDVCKRCRFVWFDAGEYDLSPTPPATGPRSPVLTQEQLEAVGRIQAEEISLRWRDKPDVEVADQLAMIPGVLGMPIEEESPEIRRLPWVTWLLAAVLCVVLFPAGFFQLVSSVYFLMVFGDNVEDFLGRRVFTVLVFTAALSGLGLHALFSRDPLVPLVGASAAISGIVVFYGLRFPQARLRYFRLYRWFSMPASAATALWILTQIVGTRDQFVGSDEVSFLAHLGGGAVGLWFWFLWRDS